MTGNGLYQLFMVIWEMGYYCYTHISDHVGKHDAETRPRPVLLNSEGAFWTLEYKYVHGWGSKMDWSWVHSKSTGQTSNITHETAILEVSPVSDTIIFKDVPHCYPIAMALRFL